MKHNFIRLFLLFCGLCVLCVCVGFWLIFVNQIYFHSIFNCIIYALIYSIESRLFFGFHLVKNTVFKSQCLPTKTRGLFATTFVLCIYLIY